MSEPSLVLQSVRQIIGKMAALNLLDVQVNEEGWGYESVRTDL